MKDNILQKISIKINELKPAELKVAQYVLEQQDEVLHQSIATVASGSKVSEPTVMRFCRSVGCKGFQDFKLALAASAVTKSAFVQTSIQESDSSLDMAQKICNYSSNTLRFLPEMLDQKVLDEAIETLEQAGRIEIYGSGASGIVALDAQHKLFRTKIPTVAYRDSHLQMMSASSLDSDSVALVFSYTGESLNIIECAKMAKEQGAIVVGVTQKGSPLTKYCDTVIYNPKIEDTRRFAPMFSRICQLAIVDILATGIAMKKGDAAWNHLKKIKQSVNFLRPFHGEKE